MQGRQEHVLFIYFDNVKELFVDVFLQCMLWTWYLANDMQFYIIAPAILFTAYRYELKMLVV